MNLRLLAVLYGVLCLVASPAWSEVIYSTDFEAGAGTEWSDRPLAFTPGTAAHPSDRFLGEFHKQSTTLTLSALPAHRTLTVAFDLYVIRSWDGNDTRDLGAGPVGPDIVRVTTHEGRTLLDTTFSNWREVLDERQSHPAIYNPAQAVNVPARTGAIQNNTLGFFYEGTPMDSVYRLRFTFPHGGSHLALTFEGLPNEPVTNESWGLDNVSVETSDSGNLVANGDFETPEVRVPSIPLPGGSAFYGWAVEGHSVDLTETVFAPAHGVQSLDLSGDAPGGVYQDIPTVPGQAYILRFALAGHPGGGPAYAKKDADVWWNSGVVDTLSVDTTDRGVQGMGYAYHAYTVVGTGLDRLRFVSTTPGPWGPALDHVSLEPVSNAFAPVLNPANGHFYQLVPDTMTWDEARVVAERTTHNGWPGHLATVTSPEETQFLWQTYGQAGYPWLGGVQRPGHAPNQGWQWVTGEPWGFTNWDGPEPNDTLDDESRLQWTSNGTWNDNAPTSEAPFLVEYEPTVVRAVFTVQPFGYVAGWRLAQQPVVTVLMANGQVDTTFNGSVALTLKSGSGNAAAQLTGATTVTANNGVAVFSGLAIDQPGNGFVLVATTPTLSSTESTPFDLGAATRPTTERVSVSSLGVGGNGTGTAPSLSADGRFVAFGSDASNLVANDLNRARDIFVHDRDTGTTERVSVATNGTEANDDSDECTLSADGRYIAFRSNATNLVPSDTNGTGDIFLHDRVMHETIRISISSAGAQANGYSHHPKISGSGRYIALCSNASNLVAGDANGVQDVFVYDRLNRQTMRVSLTDAEQQSNGNSGSSYGGLAISTDGRFIAFVSDAGNLVLGDTNSSSDIFVRDRGANTTERVSLATDGTQGNQSWGANIPALSGDGRYVAFYAWYNNLVPNDTNDFTDVFVRDRKNRTMERVSVLGDGTQGNADSYQPTLSADGRYVAFQSKATTFPGGGDNPDYAVFLVDRATGHLTCVSRAAWGGTADRASVNPTLSADGRYVAFLSDATDLVPGDTNGSRDVFVRGPLFVPYTMADALRSLRVAGGLAAGEVDDLPRLDVGPVGPLGNLDVTDAIGIARKVAGLDVNP